jgi:hypothetical protein
VEDYTHKYKGEQVEVELFGGEYRDGTLTAYCGIEGVPHLEGTSSSRSRTSPLSTARAGATRRSLTGLREV